MTSEFKCDFCGRTFKQEKTWLNHICEKKRRYFLKDDKDIILAFKAYELFYKFHYGNHKKITYLDFINSREYIGFAKFGKFLLDFKIRDPQHYIIFLIKNSVKMRHWCSQDVLNLYLKDRLEKESLDDALERTITTIFKWSDDTKKEWKCFFSDVSSSRLVNLIQTGEFSPWFLFVDIGSERNLYNQLDDQQRQLISDVVNLVLWKKKISINNKEFKKIESSLGEIFNADFI